MTRVTCKALHKRIVGALVIILILGPVAGCGSAYTGQVAVPNTSQRLVVGHDNWPSKQIWVIEGGNVESVKIIRGERK